MKVRAKNYYLEKEILLIAFKRDDIFSSPPYYYIQRDHSIVNPLGNKNYLISVIL